MDSIVVTGGTGFIGRHVVDAFRNENYELYVWTRQKISSSDAHVEYIQGDISDAVFVHRFMSQYRPKQLFHLAWDVADNGYASSARNAIWINWSENLVREFLQTGGQEVFAAGTCFEYDLTRSELLTTDSPCNPTTDYGKAKLATYRRLQALCDEYDRRLVWGRIFYPSGVGENPRKLITSTIDKVIRREPIVCNTPDNVVDYIDVRDIAEIWHRVVLDKSIRGAVNIGSGEGVRIADIMNEVKSLANYPLDIRFREQSKCTKIISDDRLLKRIQYQIRYRMFDTIREIWQAKSRGVK